MGLVMGALVLLILCLLAVLTVRLVLFVGAFAGFLIVATLHLIEWCGQGFILRFRRRD